MKPMKNLFKNVNMKTTSDRNCTAVQYFIQAMLLNIYLKPDNETVNLSLELEDKSARIQIKNEL